MCEQSRWGQFQTSIENLCFEITVWFSQTGEASCTCPFTSSIYIYAYFTLGAFVFGGISWEAAFPVYQTWRVLSSALRLPIFNLKSSKEAIFSILLSSNLRYLLSYKSFFFTKANLQASWKPGCPLLGQEAWFYLALQQSHTTSFFDKEKFPNNQKL